MQACIIYDVYKPYRFRAWRSHTPHGAAGGMAFTGDVRRSPAPAILLGHADGGYEGCPEGLLTAMLGMFHGGVRAWRAGALRVGTACVRALLRGYQTAANQRSRSYAELQTVAHHEFC